MPGVNQDVRGDDPVPFRTWAPFRAKLTLDLNEPAEIALRCSSDVFSKIRADFDAAGVIQSDEQILGAMNELTLEAGNQMPATRGGAPDALAVALARQLKSE